MWWIGRLAFVILVPEATELMPSGSGRQHPMGDAHELDSARRLGCAVEDIFIAQPDDGPMALEIVDALVRSGAFDAIVLDSVPGLYSPARGAESMDTRNESLDRARLLSEGMRRLAANVDRTRTVILFGNRRSERAASVEEDFITPGGRALRFYSSIRLAIERLDVIQDGLGAAGTRVKLTTAKNKVAPPLRSCEIQLVYGNGFACTHRA